MANIESAKKRARQIIVRTDRNAARKSRIRTTVRKADEAIVAGDKNTAIEAVRLAQKELMQGVTKGTMHLRTASRRVSKLALRINTL